MEQTFETVIAGYIDNNVGLIDQFLSVELSTFLTKNLKTLFLADQFKNAGIGNDENFLQNKSIRSDVIYWLDREHDNIHENQFFDVIDAFVEYLNKTCYSGITNYEFHYALYEKGSCYKRHLDQFRENQGRAFSMIMYLDNNWTDHDGGELCIYHKDHEQIIAPMNGKCVFFKSSELEHEVLRNHAPRMSITGWLKTN